jgi:hypothetical protein
MEPETAPDTIDAGDCVVFSSCLGVGRHCNLDGGAPAARCG